MREDQGSSPQGGPHDAVSSLRRLERALARYQRGYAELVRQLQESRAEAAQWQARGRDLEQSPAVRLAHQLWRLVERVAPTGTLRRAAYQQLGVQVRAKLSAPQPVDDGPLATAESVPPLAACTSPEPDVSIVVPAHDHWTLTASCLASLARHPPAVDFEVVVVDDGSTDETVVELPKVAGIVAVRLEENRGFLAAVNAGINAARGRYLVLLNNDTQVTPGWLDALVDTAESDHTVGVVGAKLVYPDGRLQEAGGVIWSDASGHNYGRDQDPADPRFNFSREVDYCSGACLLARRELIQATGGLDPLFAPAYYEDTDLCFAARQLGYRVVYQPRATVIHTEGASHGTDTGSGIKHYQEVNQEVFATKWSTALSRQHRPDHSSVRLASWRTSAGRVVVVDHQIPMPDHDSGSVRMSRLLSLLAELGLGVTFAPANGVVIPRYRDALQDRGIEVLSNLGQLDQYLKDLQDELRLAILSRPTVAWQVLPLFRSLTPETTLVYDTVDLHYIREQRRAVVQQTNAATHSATYHRDMELVLTKLVEETWVVSDVERDVLQAEDPGLRVSVIPNIHRLEPTGPGFQLREGLLFVGNYSHPPNRDAAQLLALDILPLVHKTIPDVPLTLVGSDPTDDVLALASEHVRVPGWVEDLEHLYHHSRVMAAPLSFGAGMKGKVGESLAYGLPVVTTPIGVEGMHLTHRREVLLAEEAQEFADAIVAAYTDPSLWSMLARNGRQVVVRLLSPDAVREQLLSTLGGLGILRI